MPKVTVSVDTGSEDGEPVFQQYEVRLDQTIGELKDLVTRDLGLPKGNQQWYSKGEPLTSESQTLSGAGIEDQDMLTVIQVHQNSQNRRSAQQPQVYEQEVERLRNELLQRTQGAGQRQAFAQQAPELAAALNDPARFREVFTLQRSRVDQQHAVNDDNTAFLNSEMNEETQAKILEKIRQDQIEVEATAAMNNHPELFGRVTMLYVQLEVNGHPVKAFVDSGAQATIMSPSCAETCNVTKSIDTRFAGIARGVGTAKILGRVHMANVKIGDYELPCSFTVMEGKDVDMLLGLDMLKRYQACIDLQKNKLVLAGSVSVPFLGEAEIPRYFEEAMDNEPTISGPEGVSIGAESGAIKSTGSMAQSSSSQASSSKSSSNFAGQGRSLGAASSSSSQSASKSQPGPPQTPARSPLPPRPSAPTPGHAQFPESSIELLLGLGARSRDQAIQLLQACNGNTEYAAGMLFEQ